MPTTLVKSTPIPTPTVLTEVTPTLPDIAIGMSSVRQDIDFPPYTIFWESPGGKAKIQHRNPESSYGGGILKPQAAKLIVEAYRQSSTFEEATKPVFESVDAFIDELFCHMVEIARLICPKFWNKNRNVFSVSSMSANDLIQSVIYQVWVRKYQDHIRKNPSEFTINCFRKRAYTAASNVCKVHRRYLLAQKRKCEENQAVEVEENTLMTEDDECHSLGDISQFLDLPVSTSAQRLILMLYSGKSIHEAKRELFPKNLGFPRNSADSLIAEIKNAVTMGDSNDTPIPTTTKKTKPMKASLQELVNKAKSSASPSMVRMMSTRETMMKAINTMTDAQLEEMHRYALEIISGKHNYKKESDTVGDKRQSRHWMKIDYGLLRDFFGLELNSACNPLVALTAIKARIAEWRSKDSDIVIPKHIQEVVMSLQEVQQITLEDLESPISKPKIASTYWADRVEGTEDTFAVCATGGSTSDSYNVLVRDAGFLLWVDTLNISHSLQVGSQGKGGKMILASTTLKSWSNKQVSDAIANIVQHATA